MKEISHVNTSSSSIYSLTSFLRDIPIVIACYLTKCDGIIKHKSVLYALWKLINVTCAYYKSLHFSMSFLQRIYA